MGENITSKAAPGPFCSCSVEGVIDCCENPALVNDGYCHDNVNNAECNFDGGDCCGSNVNIMACADCICCYRICLVLIIFLVCFVDVCEMSSFVGCRKSL